MNVISLYEGGRNVLHEFIIPKSPKRKLSIELSISASINKSFTQLIQSRDSSARAEVGSLPSFLEQQFLPQEVQDALKAVAIEILRRLFYPIVFLRKRKLERKALLDKVEHERVELAPFIANPVFSPWTNLKSVIQAFEQQPIVYQSGEIVLYQHDISQSGVWYLASGTVEICNKRTWNSKSLGSTNRDVLAVIRGPKILGEFAMLSDQPRVATVVCKTQCLFYVLDKVMFHSLFDSLDPTLKKVVNNMGYVKRMEMMKQAYPVNVEHIRKCALFNEFPNSVLQRMIDNFVPLPVPRKGIVCAQGDEAENLFYIANGKVGVYRAPPDQCEPSTFVVKLSSGAIVGEMSLIVYQKRSATIIAFTSCDLFTLSKQTFQQLLTSVQGVQRSIIGKASVQQEKWMQQQKAHFLPYVQDIPFLKMRDLPNHAYIDLTSRFMPKVYLHHDSITSRSELCDRVIIVIHGNAFIADENSSPALHVGESIGYACLVPHRWTRYICAHETVECIELPVQRYISWLRYYNVYDFVLHKTEVLMNPLLFINEHASVNDVVKTLSNPPTFPINHTMKHVQFASRHAREKFVQPEPPQSKPMITKTIKTSQSSTITTSTMVLPVVPYASPNPQKTAKTVTNSTITTGPSVPSPRKVLPRYSFTDVAALRSSTTNTDYNTCASPSATTPCASVLVPYLSARQSTTLIAVFDEPIYNPSPPSTNKYMSANQRASLRKQELIESHEASQRKKEWVRQHKYANWQPPVLRSEDRIRLRRTKEHSDRDEAIATCVLVALTALSHISMSSTVDDKASRDLQTRLWFQIVLEEMANTPSLDINKEIQHMICRPPPKSKGHRSGRTRKISIDTTHIVGRRHQRSTSDIHHKSMGSGRLPPRSSTAVMNDDSSSCDSELENLCHR
eukprot:PhF_6_TR27119/c0_g1_i1/m.39515